MLQATVKRIQLLLREHRGKISDKHSENPVQPKIACIAKREKPLGSRELLPQYMDSSSDDTRSLEIDSQINVVLYVFVVFHPTTIYESSQSQPVAVS